MKRLGWWALAALVVCAALAPLRVQAQTGTNGTKANTLTGAPIIYYESDSTRRAVASGYGLPVAESSPDRSWYFHFQSAISGKTFQACSIAVAESYDSTASLATLGARNIALGIYIVPNAANNTRDSLSKVLLAVQARANITSANDTASAMPLVPQEFGRLATTNPSTLINSFASDPNYTHGYAVPQNTVAGRNAGEFYVVARPLRQGSSGWTFVPVNLAGFQSAPPRMSFRVRYIGTINSAGLAVATGPPIKVTLDVMGWR